jgi:hypothetical protein
MHTLNVRHIVPLCRWNRCMVQSRCTWTTRDRSSVSIRMRIPALIWAHKDGIIKYVHSYQSYVTNDPCRCAQRWWCLCVAMVRICLNRTRGMLTSSRRIVRRSGRWRAWIESSNHCNRFGVTPRVNWATTLYGGDKLRYATNIVFRYWHIHNKSIQLFISNGYLDPWSGGGVLSLPKPHKSIKIIPIKLGAHHYDLRANHPQDTR